MQAETKAAPAADAAGAVPRMRILILGINYAPEPTGIAVYTSGMARALAAAGHGVTVVCGQPYYPGWKVMPGFSGSRYTRELEDGVLLVRCPLYVPASPSGAKRILHHASFALSSLVPMIRQARRMQPDVVFTIAPSLIAAPVAKLAAKLSGARSWLHIQDLEVEAAFATGLIKEDSAAGRAALAFERKVLGEFDRVSTISPQMCRKVREKGVAPDRVVEFRNWADVDAVKPSALPSPYREEWDIATPHIALYSGSIANKQGLEIIIEAARRLQDRRDLTFLICGEGPHRARLEAMAEGLDNIRFHNLQPYERLSELVNLATIHLLPQVEKAADLVLPSKLVNMLASGRPIVATASPGTGLHAELEGCGIATPPGDAAAFAGAIARLVDDPAVCAEMGKAARRGAEERLAAGTILHRLQEQFSDVSRER